MKMTMREFRSMIGETAGRIYFLHAQNKIDDWIAKFVETSSDLETDISELVESEDWPHVSYRFKRSLFDTCVDLGCKLDVKTIIQLKPSGVSEKSLIMLSRDPSAMYQHLTTHEPVKHGTSFGVSLIEEIPMLIWDEAFVKNIFIDLDVEIAQAMAPSTATITFIATIRKAIRLINHAKENPELKQFVIETRTRCFKAIENVLDRPDDPSPSSIFLKKHAGILKKELEHA